MIKQFSFLIYIACLIHATVVECADSTNNLVKTNLQSSQDTSGKNIRTLNEVRGKDKQFTVSNKVNSLEYTLKREKIVGPNEGCGWQVEKAPEGIVSVKIKRETAFQPDLHIGRLLKTPIRDAAFLKDEYRIYKHPQIESETYKERMRTRDNFIQPITRRNLLELHPSYNIRHQFEDEISETDYTPYKPSHYGDYSGKYASKADTMKYLDKTQDSNFRETMDVKGNYDDHKYPSHPYHTLWKKYWKHSLIDNPEHVPGGLGDTRLSFLDFDERYDQDDSAFRAASLEPKTKPSEEINNQFRHKRRSLEMSYIAQIDLFLLLDQTKSIEDKWIKIAEQVSYGLGMLTKLFPSVHTGVATFTDKNLIGFDLHSNMHALGYRADYCARLGLPLQRRSYAEIKPFLSAFSMEPQTGGGDWEEASLDAACRIMLSETVGWRRTCENATPRTLKIIVIVTDAKFHVAGDVMRQTGHYFPKFKKKFYTDENEDCNRMDYPSVQQLVEIAEEHDYFVAFLVLPGGVFKGTEFVPHPSMAALGAEYQKEDGLHKWFTEQFQSTKRVISIQADPSIENLGGQIGDALRHYEVLFRTVNPPSYNCKKTPCGNGVSSNHCINGDCKKTIHVANSATEGCAGFSVDLNVESL